MIKMAIVNVSFPAGASRWRRPGPDRRVTVLRHPPPVEPCFGQFADCFSSRAAQGPQGQQVGQFLIDRLVSS
jgi:hypothetical protein